MKKIYDTLIFNKPIYSLIFIFCVTLFFAYQTQYFRLDASSDTLALENDKAVELYREVKDKYGSDEYLIITYTPKDVDLFAPEALRKFRAFENELKQLKNIESIISILSVPLIEYSPLKIDEIKEFAPILRNPGTDPDKARSELINSPFYSNLLISKDGQTTALLVQIKQDTIVANSQKQWQMDIENIRNLTKQYIHVADIYIGGVPMIVADSISFIANDLETFGVLIIVFIALLLSIIFRRIAWVILPILTSLIVSIWVIGILGFLNWPVTIVSSNFISLLLIFTLSFCVHIIVKYKEYAHDHPNQSQKEIVKETIRNISKPCFYMVITTMAAFVSLVMSNIPPIIDFGWMMTFGLGIAFIISFTLMPAMMMLIKKDKKITHYDFTRKITNFFSQKVQNHAYYIFGIFIVFMGFSVWGMSYLSVQNRFIDYYKQDTEIYKGMEVIDTQLGGTTPMDIIITAPAEFIEYQREDIALMIEDGFYEDYELSIEDGYWLSDKALLDTIPEIHNYLDGLDEIGKILSVDTSLQLLASLKDAKQPDRFYLGVLNQKIPDDVKKLFFAPYISSDGNEIRFSVRVYESHEGVNRQEMIDTIHNHLVENIGISSDQIQMTGMVVLYNNILQSLFKSQILTIGFVFITMFLMFAVLFKNIWVALVAIIPNMSITLFVLGIMGWFDIPLDIMTITIAAICFGISDDDTIHYVHRFIDEFKKSGDYKKSIERSHNTIGRAMYYTSIVIIFGFFILVFSNFVPTVYFGLLLCLSMFVALLADLTLLPALLYILKPLGRERIK